MTFKKGDLVQRVSGREYKSCHIHKGHFYTVTGMADKGVGVELLGIPYCWAPANFEKVTLQRST